MATYQKPVVVIYPPTVNTNNSNTSPNNPVANPALLTTSGGLVGSGQIFGFFFVDSNTGKTYFSTFDPFDLNDAYDGSFYQTKQEDVAIYRKPTVRGVVIVYRNLGLCSFKVTVSVMTDTIAASKTANVQVGTSAADNSLMTLKVDFNNLSGERPQITIQKNASSGPLDIISMTLVMQVEDTTLS